jgi:hypothetical protein
MTLLVHAAAAFFMTGLIWFVQVVHYPLFSGVGGAGYSDYQRRHTNATTAVVLVPMFVELATGALLCKVMPGPLVYAGFALLIAIWASTVFLQVPLHRRLADGFDAGVHRRLVATNWIRTLAWTARAGLVGTILLQEASL